jgi:magnesium transporter
MRAMPDSTPVSVPPAAGAPPPPPAAPAARCWIADAQGARETEPAAAVAAAAAGAMVWIDLEGLDEPAVAALLQPLAIHPLVIEDMVTDVNRPKVDNYGAYLYVALHSARWEDERPTLKELDIVVGANFLITYHDSATRSITSAHATIARRPHLLANGPAELLHHVLDVLVDNYLPIMERVGAEIDEVEDQVFDPMQPSDHARIIRLKRGMSALRRIVGPQRDAVLALTRDEFRPIPPEMRPYLRDVYDRIARINDLLDSYRDEISTVLELHVTMTSNRLNEVIKRLTVVATIGLPLTVVTSYFGMNFEFGEYKLSHPHVFVLALLVASGLGTLWYLRRRGWD